MLTYDKLDYYKGVIKSHQRCPFSDGLIYYELDNTIWNVFFEGYTTTELFPNVGRFRTESGNYTDNEVLNKIRDTLHMTTIKYADSISFAGAILQTNGSTLVKHSICQFLGVDYKQLEFNLYTLKQEKEQYRINSEYIRKEQEFDKTCNSRGCDTIQLNKLHNSIIAHSTTGQNNIKEMMCKLGIPEFEPVISYATNDYLINATHIYNQSRTNIENKDLTGYQAIHKEVSKVSSQNKIPYKKAFDKDVDNGLIDGFYHSLQEAINSEPENAELYKSLNWN